MDLKDHIRGIADFPKPGILFYDVSTLLRHPDAWQVAMGRMASLVRAHQPQLLAGIESRGFLLAAAVALEAGVGVVPVRKAGKLPRERLSADYTLEYGTATLEVHTDSITPGQRVLLVDDVLATGGTLAASVQLVEALGGVVVAVSVAIELAELGGRQRLAPHAVHALWST